MSLDPSRAAPGGPVGTLLPTTRPSALTAPAGRAPTTPVLEDNFNRAFNLFNENNVIPAGLSTLSLNEIFGKTFIIEKKISVPSSNLTIEEAYIAEDKDKVLPYNLLFKVGEDESSFGNLLKKQSSAENIEFNLKKVDDNTTKEIKLPIVVLNNDTILPDGSGSQINNSKPTVTIYVSLIQNVRIESKQITIPENTTYSNIVLLKTERKKTGTTEGLIAKLPFALTIPQKQVLAELEPQIMNGLKTFLNYNTNSTALSEKADRLNTKWRSILPTFSQTDVEAKDLIKELLNIMSDTLDNAATKQTLIDKIKQYTGILGYSEVYDSKYKGEYQLYKKVIGSIAGAYRQGSVRKAVDEDNNINKIKLQTVIDLDLVLNKPILPVASQKWNAFKGFFGKKPVAPPAPPAPVAPGAAGGSLKRLKIKTDEDGKQFVSMDKKKHTVKESKKGLYITLEGKREYLKHY
jgi:hypothetical protein